MAAEETLSMNFDYMDNYKKNIALILVVLLIASVFAFSEVFVAGAKFMTGNNLEPDSDRFGSGEKQTGKPNWIQKSYQDEISNLTEREYYVTQRNGTEPPFENELYDEKRKGIYVDVVSGEPLFSSKSKFNSGTGWPSFYRPLEPENIVERPDPGPLGDRVEIRSKHADSHLGHVFKHPDTPTGLRYCMNSAALKFIPAEDLKEEGYGQYTDLFR